MASVFENPKAAISKDVVSTLVLSMCTVKSTKSEDGVLKLMSSWREEVENSVELGSSAWRGWKEMENRVDGR